MYMLLLTQVLVFIIGWVTALQNKSRETNKELPLWTRLTLSFSLSGAALLFWLNHLDSPYHRWVFFGMLLSTLGDLFMAGLIPFANHLIGGMITFSIAHVFYVVAFIQTADVTEHLFTSVLIYGAFLIIGWIFFIRNPAESKIFTVGALLYGLWVGGMAAVGLALALKLGGAWWWVAIGGSLFVLSDFLIGMTEIGKHPLRHAPLWIWGTYVAAQMGIIYASL
jgi:uncharacterized membrane protein YhhN